MRKCFDQKTQKHMGGQMLNSNVIQSYISKRLKSSGLHHFQVLSIIFFIENAVRGRTLVPTHVGRARNEYQPRSGSKRVHRLIKNERISNDVMDNVLTRSAKKLIEKSKKQIVLVIDWTTIKEHFNFFSISLLEKKGRTIPLYFTGYKQKEMPENESQPRIEQEAIRKIINVVRALDRNKKIIIIADRGFCSPETLNFLVNNRVSYIIRAITGKTVFFTNGRSRMIDHDMVKKGTTKAYYDIIYTETRAVPSNLYCIWNKEQTEPWLLLSNMAGKKVSKIAALYEKRVEIEEMFKSMKNEQVGFELKQTKLRHIDRWHRYLFLTVLLFQCLSEIGTAMQQVDKIEQRYSLSSKTPKKQKRIFSYYYLALLILNDSYFQLRYNKKLEFKIPGHSWILLE
jgi:hypothetical protein